MLPDPELEFAGPAQKVGAHNKICWAHHHQNNFKVSSSGAILSLFSSFLKRFL